jgi:hypothetical protein
LFWLNLATIFDPYNDFVGNYQTNYFGSIREFLHLKKKPPRRHAKSTGLGANDWLFSAAARAKLSSKWTARFDNNWHLFKSTERGYAFVLQKGKGTIGQ